MISPAVSVVVATLGESALLPRVLEQLRRQADGLKAELLLVVNAEEGGFDPPRLELWRGLADQLLFVPEPGKSRALNQAVLAARGEVLAFLDDDAEPAPGWLRTLTAPLLAGAPELAGTGGRVIPVYPEGGPPAWYRQFLSNRSSRFLGPHHDLGPEALDYRADSLVAPFGANCAYRRAALLDHPYPVELGPNRKTGLRGGEDTVVAMSLLRAGKRLAYVPEAFVYHPVEADRMTRSFVERGYYLQGVESYRIRRLLGMEVMSASELRAKIGRRFLPWVLLPKLLPRKRRRADLRQLYYRGLLSEHAREAGR